MRIPLNGWVSGRQSGVLASRAILLFAIVGGCAPRTPADSPEAGAQPAPEVAAAAAPGAEHPLTAGYYPTSLETAALGKTGDKPATASGPPNIVIIWGDDIGQSNISAYSKGQMGFQTPSIDSIAREGLLFTDYYAEQSCTAGRAAFITGQSVFRTGLSKVGLPGRAALFGVVIGEEDALTRDAVDAGRLKAHLAFGVGADVALADVVAPDDDDVRRPARGRRLVTGLRERRGFERRRVVAGREGMFGAGRGRDGHVGRGLLRAGFGRFGRRARSASHRDGEKQYCSRGPGFGSRT